jgi:predicted RNA-binding Zn-ribbon protein involved in translation (DUF1610 family)/anti-anti-sigma regulatory factor
VIETLGRLEAAVDGDASQRRIELRGRIDEASPLSTRAEAWASREVVIDTAAVVFINSIGVREWMRLLRGLVDRGARVVLERCAEVIIEQINMITDARGSAEVRSFHAPYQCPGCGLETSALLDVARHGDAMRRMEAPAVPCPDCGQAMELYEVPERFFTFLVS